MGLDGPGGTRRGEWTLRTRPTWFLSRPEEPEQSDWRKPLVIHHGYRQFAALNALVFPVKAPFLRDDSRCHVWLPEGVEVALELALFSKHAVHICAVCSATAVAGVAHRVVLLTHTHTKTSHSHGLPAMGNDAKRCCTMLYSFMLKVTVYNRYNCI